MPLPFEHPPLMPDETLQGFVGRIARYYATDVVEYCNVVGIPILDLVAGRDPAVRRIGSMTGLDVSALAHHTFVRTQKAAWTYMGQSFLNTGLSRMKMHGCPACLREDVAGSALEPEIAAYVRGHWYVRAVRTCTRHHLGFVPLSSDLDTHGRYGPYDSALRLAPSLDRLDVLERAAPARRPSDFEAYVHARVTDGAVRPGLLDAMPLHAATRTCEVVGAVALHGSKVRIGSLDDDDRRAAGAVGFDLVCAGSEALRTLLEFLRADHRPGRKKTGKSRNVFGVLYLWLRSTGTDADHAPVREVMRELLLETMPFDVGSDLFGRPVERSRVHSMSTACHDGRHASQRRARELRAAGVLTTELDENRHQVVHVGVESIDAVVAALSAGLSRAQAATRLSVTGPQFQKLVDAGLIRPIVPKDRSTSFQSRFAAGDLDDFLRKLEDVAIVDEREPKGLTSVAEAARVTGAPMAFIVGHLLTGGMTVAARRSGTSGYPSLLVDPGEVGRLLKGETGSRLRFGEVATRLQVNVRTPAKLAEAGYLQVLSERGRRTHGISHFVTAASVEAFASEMASLVEISRAHGIHNVKMMRLLEEKGVTPAIPNGRVLANFYRRSDVESAAYGWG